MSQMQSTVTILDARGAAERLLRLVEIASPSGQEAEAVRWLHDQACADGLQSRIDRVGNLVIEVGHGPLHILFVGHIDTHPGMIGTGIRDGRVWGRGSVDAKGCLIAAYEAIRTFQGSDAVSITFVAAVGEETDSRGVQGMCVSQPDVIINGEPSGWDAITIGYKGIVRGHFHARSAPVHGGHPEPGALDRTMAWWADAQAALATGTGYDDVTLRMDDLCYAPSAEVNVATGAFQVRLPPSMTPERLTEDLEASGRGHGVIVDVHEMLPAALGDGRDPLAAAFRTAIRQAGGRPRMLRKTGTSDLNHLALMYPGVPVLAYGPGDSSLDHTPNEHLPIAELARAVTVWQTAITTLSQHGQTLK